jgi:hypothetical protein
MGTRQLAVFAILVAVGCGSRDRSQEDPRAFTSVDPWYSPPPSTADFTPLAEDRFAPVADALQLEAQAALAKTSAKQVSAEEAARLASKRLPAGKEFVLLRAVVLGEDTRGFHIGVSGGAVHVHHGCLGRSPVPMARRALIAVLPSVPETVYVSCSMIE